MLKWVVTSSDNSASEYKLSYWHVCTRAGAQQRLDSCTSTLQCSYTCSELKLTTFCKSADIVEARFMLQSASQCLLWHT